TPQTKLFAPFQATMAGDVERQFQPAPDSKFVKRVPQIILYYLLRRPDGQGDLAVCEPLPHQECDLHFLRCQPLTRLHDLSAPSQTLRSQASRACDHLEFPPAGRVCAGAVSPFEG